MKNIVKRHWLAFILTLLAGGLLFGLAAIESVPSFLDYEQTRAISHNMVPTPETVACKTAKSCYQKQLQKEFAAKRKAEMKAFQADEKAKLKAKYKPQQKAIEHNRDLSANEKKSMLKELADQEKFDTKDQIAQEKAALKHEEEQEKAMIKELVKNCGC